MRIVFLAAVLMGLAALANAQMLQAIISGTQNTVSACAPFQINGTPPYQINGTPRYQRC